MCCSNTAILFCNYDLCSGDIDTGIAAGMDGEYTIKVSPFDNLHKVTLITGQYIILPAFLFNESAAHTVEITGPNGDVLNNTCYRITTKIYNRCK